MPNSTLRNPPYIDFFGSDLGRCVKWGVERPRMGLGVPLPDWLRGPLRDWAEDLVNEAGLSADDIFDVEGIRSLWAEFLRGDNKRYYLIWNVLMFQAWHRRWGDASVVDTGTRRLAPLLN
jgi:asparagine synthase (glutamine-hydrolysing)